MQDLITQRQCRQQLRSRGWAGTTIDEIIEGLPKHAQGSRLKLKPSDIEAAIREKLAPVEVTISDRMRTRVI